MAALALMVLMTQMKATSATEGSGLDWMIEQGRILSICLAFELAHTQLWRFVTRFREGRFCKYLCFVTPMG